MQHVAERGHYPRGAICFSGGLFLVCPPPLSVPFRAFFLGSCCNGRGKGGGAARGEHGVGGGGHKRTQDLGSRVFLLQLGSQAGVYAVLSVAGTQSLGGGMLGPLAPEQETQPDAGASCLQGGGKALPAYGVRGGGGERSRPVQKPT